MRSDPTAKPAAQKHISGTDDAGWPYNDKSCHGSDFSVTRLQSHGNLRPKVPMKNDCLCPDGIKQARKT